MEQEIYRLQLKKLLSAHKCFLLSPKVQELLISNVKAFSCSQELIKWFKIIFICAMTFLSLNYYFSELKTLNCALSLPRSLSYAFRPPQNCNFCRNIKSVPHLGDFSSTEFEAFYAYSGAPVIITDAIQNWTATKLFNYWYFRDVYLKAKRKQRIANCQFLPYKTGFQDIYEALDMSQARVELQEGESPWYFGWSNCQADTAEEFRKHYSRPYFLPESSENNAVDWIFIGTAGLGAQMHIDNVRLPSWQAQLSGSKLWLLVPPPECYFQCQRFEVVVKQGDIIVLDTNKWYHQTFVQPGVVSITIGAEYD